MRFGPVLILGLGFFCFFVSPALPEGWASSALFFGLVVAYPVVTVLWLYEWVKAPKQQKISTPALFFLALTLSVVADMLTEDMRAFTVSVFGRRENVFVVAFLPLLVLLALLQAYLRRRWQSEEAG